MRKKDVAKDREEERQRKRGWVEERNVKEQKRRKEMK